MTLRRLFRRPGAQAPRASKSSKAPSSVPQGKPTAHISTACATYGSDAIASMIAPPAMPSSTGDDSDGSSDTDDSLKMVRDASRPSKDRDLACRALQRRPGLKFGADAVQHAARAWDRDMIAFLLDTQGPKVHLTCGVIEAAVRNAWFGEEVISLLLGRVAAFENKRCGRDILLQLLSNPGVSVASGGVVNLLLNKPDIRVTDKALVAAARSDDWQVFEMLFARTSNIRCVEDIAAAAAGNQKAGWQIFRLLVDRGLEIPASETVWKAAAGHEKYGRKMIGKLLDQQGKVLDSEETILAAARNTGTGWFIIAFLLTHATSSQLVLTDKMILAAVDNKPHATDLVDLFLEKSSNEVQLTGRIVQGFTEPPAKEIPWINSVKFDICDAIFYILNGKHQDRFSFTAEALGGIMRRGTYELICQLLDTLGKKISITEKMIEAAAESNHGYDVAKIVQRLFRHTPSVKVTERAVIFAAGRSSGGERLFESFFEHDRGLQVPPEAIEAAANSRFWASDLVGILLGQTPTVQITETAIAAAGQDMYDTSTFDLLLSKCRGEIRLSLQGLPYMLRGGDYCVAAG
ncbi:hypothetical protein BJY01DRAFT_241193 [Aspergillus pseudoustus]|uniref:Ankyrin repeat-containing domain protein n=1 Tax=Aspergillus pseudoustus TaxID=1810923 RepID=A0ABR4IHS3_9EURO